MDYFKPAEIILKMQNVDGIISWVLLILELTCLIVFVYFTGRFIKNFRTSEAAFAIITFVFIIIMLVGEVVLGSIGMILIIVQYNMTFTEYIDGIQDGTVEEGTASCILQVSRTLAVTFFTGAILANIFMWIHIILFYNKPDSNKRKIIEYLLLAVNVLVIVVICVLYSVDSCISTSSSLDEAAQYSYNIGLCIYLFVAIVIYMGTCFYFRKKYSVSISISGDPCFRAELTTSQKRLTWFFFIISLILLFRLAMQLSQYFQDQPNYLLSEIGFSLAEMGVVLLLVYSIKKGLEDNDHCSHSLLFNVDGTASIYKQTLIQSKSFDISHKSSSLFSDGERQKEQAFRAIEGIQNSDFMNPLIEAKQRPITQCFALDGELHWEPPQEEQTTRVNQTSYLKR